MITPYRFFNIPFSPQKNSPICLDLENQGKYHKYETKQTQ